MVSGHVGSVSYDFAFCGGVISQYLKKKMVLFEKAQKREFLQASQCVFRHLETCLFRNTGTL